MKTLLGLWALGIITLFSIKKTKKIQYNQQKF